MTGGSELPVPVIDFPLRGQWESLNSPGHDRYAYDFTALQAGRRQSKGLASHLLGRATASDFYG